MQPLSMKFGSAPSQKRSALEVLQKVSDTILEVKQILTLDPLISLSFNGLVYVTSVFVPGTFLFFVPGTVFHKKIQQDSSGAYGMAGLHLYL